jgi:hypothetical protein
MGRMIEPKKCTVCNLGFLIPRGDNLDYFKCDNLECPMNSQNKNADKNIFDGVTIYDSVSSQVTTYAELQARLQERRCTKCNERKRIYYYDMLLVLCKHCYEVWEDNDFKYL